MLLILQALCFIALGFPYSISSQPLPSSQLASATDNHSLSPKNFSLCRFAHERYGHHFKRIKMRATMVLIPKESSPQEMKAHHFYFQHRIPKSLKQCLQRFYAFECFNKIWLHPEKETILPHSPPGHPLFLTLSTLVTTQELAILATEKFFFYNSHFPNLLGKWPVTNIANYDKKWLGTIWTWEHAWSSI